MALFVSFVESVSLCHAAIIVLRTLLSLIVLPMSPEIVAGLSTLAAAALCRLERSRRSQRPLWRFPGPTTTMRRRNAPQRRGPPFHLEMARGAQKRAPSQD